VAYDEEWNVPTTTSFRATDLDEARAVCGDFFVPRSMRLLDPAARLAARFDITWMPAVTIGDVEYGAEITGRCAHLDNYHINVPVAGGFLARQGRRGVQGSTGVASVYRPTGGLTLERASADCRILTVQIDRQTLEDHLAALLDAPVRGPLRLPIALDVTRAPGRGWAELAGILAADITDPNALIHHPMTAGPLQESLLTATLLAMDHQYRDALERTTAGPRTAQRVTAAVEAIETHPERAYTSETLAELAGVSVRGLRLGFRRRLDMSPMAFLWHTRLSRVHDELRAADPRRTTVREVARRWGFVHLGRFAAAYLERYRVTPTQTLYAPAGPGGLREARP
jgi:AraC-like DNA-binding protein